MEKTAIVVVGYEGTGSVFISKTVSYVLGYCSSFGEWNGYGFNRKPKLERNVLHRSIPYNRPRKWHDEPNELKSLFPDHDKVRFIVTTRDLTISTISRRRRFGGSFQQYREDNQRTTRLLQRIISEEDCFIWSYETMCALREPYFQKLYGWLGCESDFVPEIQDANAAHFAPQLSTQVNLN